MNNKYLLIFFTFFVKFALGQYEIINSYYDNGNLKAEISYVNSVRDGICKYYYENGNPYQILFFDKGILSGEFLQFHPNGKLQIKAYYKDGILDGIKFLYDSLGNLIEYTNYSYGKIVKKTILLDTLQQYTLVTPANINQKKETILQRRYLKFLTKNTSVNNYLSYQSFNIKDRIPKILSNYKVINNLVLSDKDVTIKDKDFLNFIYQYIPYPSIIDEYSLEGISWIKIIISPEGKLINSEIVYYLGFGCDYFALDAINNIKEYWDDIFSIEDITTIILPLKFKK